MLRFLRQLAENDNALKLLFDHVRNIGLSALVLGAATWKHDHARSGSAVDMVAVGLLYAMGVFLFSVNFYNGVIVHVHGRKEGQIEKPRWLMALVGTFYALLVTAIIEYLSSRR